MNPHLEREGFVAGLVSWLNRHVAPPDTIITPASPLFETGLVDSVRILDLIAWTERATGTRIADARIVMDNFRTAERIAEVFVGDGGAVAGSGAGDDVVRQGEGSDVVD